jgi:hypothetical protein
LRQLLFAQRHLGLVDEDVEHAGVGKVEQGREQRQAGRRLPAARRQHRQRAGGDGAADAEAEHVDFVLAADLARDFDRLDRALLDEVVPGQVRSVWSGLRQDTMNTVLPCSTA